MQNEISIGNRKIGKECPPYIIVEVSEDHNEDIKRTQKLVKVAKAAGASVVKLRIYNADLLTIPSKDDLLSNFSSKQKETFLFFDGNGYGINEICLAFEK